MAHHLTPSFALPGCCGETKRAQHVRIAPSPSGILPSCATLGIPSMRESLFGNPGETIHFGAETNHLQNGMATQAVLQAFQLICTEETDWMCLQSDLCSNNNAAELDLDSSFFCLALPKESPRPLPRNIRIKTYLDAAFGRLSQSFRV